MKKQDNQRVSQNDLFNQTQNDLAFVLANLFWVDFHVTTREELSSNSQQGNYDDGKEERTDGLQIKEGEVEERGGEFIEKRRGEN